MKENKRPFVRNVALSALALSLAACGGGGSSTSSTPSPALSDAQKNYEGAALASNGGLHSLSGVLSFSASGSGMISIYTAGSYFFSTDSSIPASPANVSQPVSVADASIATTLQMPTLPATRFLVNALVLTQARAEVSYSGDNILETYLATDGITTVHTFLDTGITTVPLTGLIANSPVELFSDSALGIIINTINGLSLYNLQASWQSGSTYLKITRQVVGDTVSVDDCGAPATTGANPTPCSASVGTLEAFFPYVSAGDGKTYNLSDGQIETLQGERTWVANVASTTQATTRYRVFYQNNGTIDEGFLAKDGAPVQTESQGTGAPLDFAIFLNNAALQSVKSAISF